MAKKTDFKNPELLSSVILALVGLLLVIFRTSVLQWAMTAVGAVFVVFGVLDLLKKNWLNGGLSIVIGAAIIAFGWALTEIVLIVLGVLIALKSLISLYEVLNKKKKNASEIIYAAAGVILGVLLAFGNLVSALVLVAGILFIIDGAIGIFGELSKSKKK